MDTAGRSQGPGADELARLRKRVAELEDSEDRFRSAFDLCPDPMSITRSTDGAILEVNEAWCALTGFDREEVVGRTSAELGLVRDVVARLRWLREVNTEGRANEVEFELQRKDGTTRRIRATSRKLRAGPEVPILNVLSEVPPGGGRP